MAGTYVTDRGPIARSPAVTSDRAVDAVARTLGCALWGLLAALAAGPLDLDELARRTRIDRSALRARLVALVFSGAVIDRDGRFGRAG
jgi:predicted Rossmann fold nucleotide-binding protein DprA/Smf involved in DNA uptake